MREIVKLECSECKMQNYTTTKNKKKQTEKLAYTKYCPKCNKRVIHKEVK